MKILRNALAVSLLAALSFGMTSQVKENERATPIEEWASETIALPPAFAPTMPKGTEVLRFAPGWRDPKAEGFWSYAIVMWIDEPTPSMSRIDTLLETYYNGLLTVFAEGDGKTISKTPAQVKVKLQSKGKYEAVMQAVDAFATYKPIQVMFEIETVSLGKSRSSLRIKASPQPKTHSIWKSMDAATADILAKNKNLDG